MFIGLKTTCRLPKQARPRCAVHRDIWTVTWNIFKFTYVVITIVKRWHYLSVPDSHWSVPIQFLNFIFSPLVLRKLYIFISDFFNLEKWRNFIFLNKYYRCIYNSAVSIKFVRYFRFCFRLTFERFAEKQTKAQSTPNICLITTFFFFFLNGEFFFFNNSDFLFVRE